MKRRSFLKGIGAAIACKALPAPKLAGVLTGSVVVAAPRPITISGIRERVHQPIWDTLTYKKRKRNIPFNGKKRGKRRLNFGAAGKGFHKKGRSV